MQRESQRSSVEPLPAAIQDAVAAAIEDGATMDAIVARVRAWNGEGSPSTEGRSAECMDSLICLQREVDRCADEWEHTRAHGAEGRSALVVIESLRSLALCTLADLGKRSEPVPTEDLARLALALYRIESADRLRLERERAMADAGTDPGLARRAARMTHAERVDTVRRAMEEHLFPWRTDSPSPAFRRAEAASEDSHFTPPAPPSDLSSDDGVQDGLDARRAHDAQDADGALDVWDAHEAHDLPSARKAHDLPSAREAHDVPSARAAHDVPSARDADLRRRKAEAQLWPTAPPFCPAAWNGPG